MKRSMIGHLLPCLALAVGCQPAVHLTRGGRVHPEQARLGPEELRDHFTRAAVPPDLEFRWMEATLIDRSWVKAEVERWGRLVSADEEGQRERLDAALGEMGELPAQDGPRADEHEEAPGVGFEIWLFTHCDGCEDLSRWFWTLSGPGPEGPVRAPSHIRWEVVDSQDQTLRILDVSRVVKLKKVRALLRFASVLKPGQWVLHGSPGRGYEPFTFKWRIPKE